MTDLNEKLSLLLDDYADEKAAATLDEVIGDRSEEHTSELQSP